MTVLPIIIAALVPSSAVVAFYQIKGARRGAAEALRESAQRLQLAALSGSLGIWDHNLQDGTLVWDDRMYEIYGLDRVSFQPSYEAWCERIVHPEDRAVVRAKLQAAFDDDLPYRVEFRVLLPSGAVRHICSNGMVLRNAQGKPIRVLGFNRDRTEQVRAEAERRRLQEERQHAEKLESLGSLAGGMAHDMNNLLAAILGTTEVLRAQFSDGDPVAKALDCILHASGRGRDLVRALTEFARKGLDQVRPVDLNELLGKEVELLRHTAPGTVQMVLDLEPTLPWVLGDASALGGTIMNLSVNALDAMPDGGTLRFRSRALATGMIELTVGDTGQGMPPEVMARALEPFFTTKPVGKGTGLGLARVYGTVTAHGGTVAIQSQLGQGTQIILRLPGLSQEDDPAALATA